MLLGPDRWTRGHQGTKCHSFQSPIIPTGTQLGPQGTGQLHRPWTPAMWFYVPSTRTHRPGECVLLHDTVSLTREPTALGTRNESRAETTCSSPRTHRTLVFPVPLTLGCAGSKVLIPMGGCAFQGQSRDSLKPQVTTANMPLRFCGCC